MIKISLILNKPVDFIAALTAASLWHAKVLIVDTKCLRTEVVVIMDVFVVDGEGSVKAEEVVSNGDEE